MTSNTQHLKDTKADASEEHNDNKQGSNHTSSDKKDVKTPTQKHVHEETHPANKAK
jgi:hypothetical protein